MDSRHGLSRDAFGNSIAPRHRIMMPYLRRILLYYFGPLLLLIHQSTARNTFEKIQPRMINLGRGEAAGCCEPFA